MITPCTEAENTADLPQFKMQWYTRLHHNPLQVGHASMAVIYDLIVYTSEQVHNLARQ